MLRFGSKTNTKLESNQNDLNETSKSNNLDNKKRKKNESVSESSSDDEDDFTNGRLLAHGGEESGELDQEEKNLEELVFGSETKIFSNIDKLNKKKLKSKSKQEVTIVSELADNLIERKPAWQDNDDQEIVNISNFNQFSSLVNTKSDEVKNSQIEESLKARFNKYYGTPMWADLKESKEKKKNKKSTKDDDGEENSSEDEEENDRDDDESLFKQTGNYLASTSDRRAKTKSSLPKSILDIKVCTDGNKEEPHQARLKSVEFHPSARVMLTAGLSQKLSLFQVC
jgi:U3 small nucleolar RNA-associated protein 18